MYYMVVIFKLKYLFHINFWTLEMFLLYNYEAFQISLRESTNFKN